jgi:hypothetical protein
MNPETFVRAVPLLFTLGAALATPGTAPDRVAAQSASSSVVPKAWNDRDLSDWATPLRGLGLRPGFYSQAEFEQIPVAAFYRTYPMYHPDYEPAGYWEWLQKQPPRPLLDSATLHSERDWMEAGRIVFRELYRPGQGGPRGFADLIPLVRSPSALERANIKPLPDGTLPLVWAVTPEGVLPMPKACSSCHTWYMPDGTTIDGAASGTHAAGPVQRLRQEVERRDTETLRAGAYARWAVPWLNGDIAGTIKSMTRKDIEELFAVELRNSNGIMPRGGSPFFPTKILDLNGVRDRKYLDHTATHLNRGVGDIMRYAFLVECCNAEIFGPYRFGPTNRQTGEPLRPSFRFPDDVIFALATYIYSLEPPSSPYRADPLAAEGKKIFEREGCAACHTPPLYTNNKLTLAKGFVPPADHPYTNDIMPESVGTDPGRAMQTHVGTGFYKVPSLKGVWYRNLFGHAGDVASLEDWFDPARLRDDYVPSGWRGLGQTHRAVAGHEFGLQLPTAEKRALIVFLKTL